MWKISNYLLNVIDVTHFPNALQLDWFIICICAKKQVGIYYTNTVDITCIILENQNKGLAEAENINQNHFSEKKNIIIFWIPF